MAAPVFFHGLLFLGAISGKPAAQFGEIDLMAIKLRTVNTGKTGFAADSHTTGQ